MSELSGRCSEGLRRYIVNSAVMQNAQEEAALEGKDLDEFHPYVVNDQGFSLRGRPFNLTVSWNVMPLVGTHLLMVDMLSA